MSRKRTVGAPRPPAAYNAQLFFSLAEPSQFQLLGNAFAFWLHYYRKKSFLHLAYPDDECPHCAKCDGKKEWRLFLSVAKLITSGRSSNEFAQQGFSSGWQKGYTALTPQIIEDVGGELVAGMVLRTTAPRRSPARGQLIEVRPVVFAAGDTVVKLSQRYHVAVPELLPYEVELAAKSADPETRRLAPALNGHAH